MKYVFISCTSNRVEVNRNLSSYRKSVDVHFMPRVRLHFFSYTVFLIVGHTYHSGTTFIYHHIIDGYWVLKSIVCPSVLMCKNTPNVQPSEHQWWLITLTSSLNK